MGQRIPVTLGNIAPLSLRPFQPGRIALVCEGGGQRENFTAGVLDEFMRAEFNPFNLYLGTSAGRTTSRVYLRSARQRAQSHHALYHKTRIFQSIALCPWRKSYRSRLAGGGHRKPDAVAMDTAARLFDSGKSFYMCACRQDDYAPNYFLPTKQNWLDVIRASSAIPGFYRSGVSLEGINYLDGGIGDAIPVKEAARQGAKTLVVIRTVPSQMYYTPQWFNASNAGWVTVACSRW
ncbi:patatin-like phospholipase family protein [Shigella flexneri]